MAKPSESRSFTNSYCDVTGREVTRASRRVTIYDVSGTSRTVGRRILVDGMMSSGKSTFARRLAAHTGLPLIHLDYHYWKPGWIQPSDEVWCDVQRRLIAGDSWIIDGNYAETLALRLERADTIIVLTTAWWRCAWRSFLRGLGRSRGRLPEGCENSTTQRIRDEWGGIGRIWLHRRSLPELTRRAILEHGSHTNVVFLHTRRAATALLRDI